MKCLYCEEPMPITLVEHSHHCPKIGDGEGQCVRTTTTLPSCLSVLLDLARSVSTTLPSSGSTWGGQARRALDLARQEGVLS